MKRVISKYFLAICLMGGTAGWATEMDVKAPNAILSLEGGYGMLNSSQLSNPTVWGSAGLGLGSKTLWGIEGGYLTTQEDDDAFGSVRFIERRRATYVGPFAEKIWNHQRFGMSLRGGAGVWHQVNEARVTENNVEQFSVTYSDWLPGLAFSGMAYVRITPVVNLGAGVRQILVFDASEGEVFWGTALMPFIRASVSF